MRDELRQKHNISIDNSISSFINHGHSQSSFTPLNAVNFQLNNAKQNKNLMERLKQVTAKPDHIRVNPVQPLSVKNHGYMAKKDKANKMVMPVLHEQGYNSYLTSIQQSFKTPKKVLVSHEFNINGKKL